MTSSAVPKPRDISNWSSSSGSSQKPIKNSPGHESRNSLRTNVSSVSSTPKINSPMSLAITQTTFAHTSPAPSLGSYQDSSELTSQAPRAQPYPVMEITRTDPSKQHALDVLHHTERRESRHPNLIATPALGPGLTPPEDIGSILASIRSLESKVVALQNSNDSTAEEKVNSQHSLFTGNVATSTTSVQGASEQPAYILDIKRFKKLNYRYGSAKYYDDSESIEAIRSREGAARGGGYVMNVFREYDWEGNALNGKLEICSTPLLELIRDLIDYYPGPEYDLLRWEETPSDNVSFEEPYMMLFTHRNELNQALEKPEILDSTKDHVRLLLQFLREEMPRTSAKLDEIEAGTCKKISFQDLWLLYSPNTPVYVAVNGEDRQMVVYSRNVPEKNIKGHWGVLSLYCWSSKYQGHSLTRDFYPWVIQPFTGEKAVHHLDLVPMQYLLDHNAVRRRLIERGNRYLELNRGPALQDYHGSKFPRVFKDEPIRVVVDQETFWKKQGIGMPRNLDVSEEYGFPQGEESLEDEKGAPLERALVCCYPEVGVFSLRDKEWASVRVDDLRPVQFREKAFKRLVIKDEYKKLLIAMVEAYMLEQPGFSDIVMGKGRGLTVLLHGPPGTGKTLTAECVSERQQRPLYTVSCGDLGTEPLELERRLKEIFSYAVSWKAILLMDEADIFLQERDIQNVNRNALVSIFLRELEYFDGILFLTTNRPGDIDEAFQSRIHVSIGLKALDTQERRKVWAVFIKEMDLTDKEKAVLLDHVVSSYDTDKLNGRQIRNAVRTALALAQLKREKLTTDHLDRVVKIGREFTTYMEDLNKMNQEEYAIQLGRRAPTR